jgi:hypothetical protein
MLLADIVAKIVVILIVGYLLIGLIDNRTRGNRK